MFTHWTRISARDGEMKLQRWESHLCSLSAKYVLPSSRYFQPVCAWGWCRLFLFLLRQIVLTLYADGIYAQRSNVEINLSCQSHLYCLSTVYLPPGKMLKSGVTQDRLCGQQQTSEGKEWGGSTQPGSWIKQKTHQKNTKTSFVSLKKYVKLQFNERVQWLEVLGSRPMSCLCPAAALGTRTALWALFFIIPLLLILGHHPVSIIIRSTTKQSNRNVAVSIH